VTTAATIWLVTVLGLLFGGGNLYLGIAGSLVTFMVLWALKRIEKNVAHEYHGSLSLTLSGEAPSETALRSQLLADFGIAHWSPLYEPATAMVVLNCELKWVAKASRIPETPPAIEKLRTLPGVLSLSWRE
jgi:putative Mg2+ transporter-C (MgtC) family protein